MSFAEQLAARAAKRTSTGSGTAAAPSISSSSPSRMTGGRAGGNGSSSTSKSTKTTLSDQIKNRGAVVDNRNNSDKSDNNNVSQQAAKTADETQKSSTSRQRHNKQTSSSKSNNNESDNSFATRKKSSSSSSSSSRRPKKPMSGDNQSSAAVESTTTSTTSTSRQRHREPADDDNLDNLFNESYHDSAITLKAANSAVHAAITQPMRQQSSKSLDDSQKSIEWPDDNDAPTKSASITNKTNKNNNPETKMVESTSTSTEQQQQQQYTKLKLKLDKYKTENKKLRHESLLLKAKLEEMATLVTKLQELEHGHKVQNDELVTEVQELKDKIGTLEQTIEENKRSYSSKGSSGSSTIAKMKQHGGLIDIDYSDDEEWNGIRSSLVYLRRERNKRRGTLYSSQNSGGSGGSSRIAGTVYTSGDKPRDSMISLGTFAEMEMDELVAENARLTQLMLDMGELEELQKFANSQQQQAMNSGDGGGDNGGNDNNAEKDATISELNKKLSKVEGELLEVTELKNAEIDVLRKQLNRVEQQQQHRSNTPQDANNTDEEGGQGMEWKKEREELREEIRRLNLEVSRRMSTSLDQDEEDDIAQYQSLSSLMTKSSSSTDKINNMDDADISSLQSIIEMMRQTIDQTNKEKDLLEQRLTEEQERSQNELKAFAKTLEGVDDLRKSAETMSREIRRIKVKGYRPTRSDLMGVSLGGGDLNGVRNFGELTAAVEASENMEDAIRLIEGQNDAMEERRRLGVVAASHGGGAASSSADGAVSSASAAPLARKGSAGLRAISEDDDDDDAGGGFLSFWHGVGRNQEDDDDDADKREKKKKSKRKKKRDDEGSVFTSFF
jgi:uncharacterized small protein (DUF1192 family)